MKTEKFFQMGVSCSIVNNILSGFTKNMVDFSVPVSGYVDGYYTNAGFLSNVKTIECEADRDQADVRTIKSDPVSEHCTEITNFNIDKFCQIAKFAGKDELRPQLSGIFYDAKNKCIVATDAHVLKHIPAEMGECSFIIDKNIISDIKKFVSAGLQIDRAFVKNENSIIITFSNGAKIVFPQTQGKYPDYRGVIPTYDSGKTIQINATEYKKMQELCQRIKKQKGLQYVSIDIDNSKAYIIDRDYKIEECFNVIIADFSEEITSNCIQMPVDIVTEKSGHDRDKFLERYKPNAENYISFDFGYLQYFDPDSIIYFRDYSHALLIVENEKSKSPTPKKKSEPKQAEPEESKVIVCSVPKYETEPEQVDEYPEPEPIKPTPAKVSTIPTNETSHGARNLKVIDYSDKAIAVVGDTRQIKDELKAAGGRFNAHLKCGAGWIFSKKKASEVNCIINL